MCRDLAILHSVREPQVSALILCNREVLLMQFGDRSFPNVGSINWLAIELRLTMKRVGDGNKRI